MAQKKDTTKKRRRRANPKVKRRRKSNKMDFVSPVVYGAVRGKLYSYVAPYAVRLPGGELSDEVGMILVNYMAPKVVKNAMVRKVARVGLTVELAAIGEAIGRGWRPGMEPRGTAVGGGYLY